MGKKKRNKKLQTPLTTLKKREKRSGKTTQAPKGVTETESLSTGSLRIGGIETLMLEIVPETVKNLASLAPETSSGTTKEASSVTSEGKHHLPLDKKNYFPGMVFYDPFIKGQPFSEFCGFENNYDTSMFFASPIMSPHRIRGYNFNE